MPDLGLLSKDIRHTIDKRINKQISAQYWISRLALRKVLMKEVNTFTTVTERLLSEGLNTGITMPLNLLDRISDTSETQELIENEFNGEFGYWAAATLMRTDASSVLHRVAYTSNGQLGDASSRFIPQSKMFIENYAGAIGNPFVEYDHTHNLTVPDTIRSELRKAVGYSAGYINGKTTGCPMRFEHAGTYTMITAGMGVVALILMDRARVNGQTFSN